MVTLNSISEMTVVILVRGNNWGIVQKPLGLFNFMPRGLFSQSLRTLLASVPLIFRRGGSYLGGRDGRGGNQGGRRKGDRWTGEASLGGSESFP